MEMGVPAGADRREPHFYRMLPYLITLIVLAFTQKSRAPKAEGIPYDKGQR